MGKGLELIRALRKWRWWRRNIAKLVFIGVLCLNGLVWAYEVPDNMWQGIMAEAVSEGYNGMYAVACVYRNRIEKGLPLGCCGLKRKNLNAWCNKQGKDPQGNYWCAVAKTIVLKVFVMKQPDITGGATHYENIEKFGKPYWAKNMIVTCKIGEHTFYKERSK